MKPGRELDALVAEKVMGQVVHRNPKGGWSLGPPDYWDDHGCTELVNPLPAYSEDIAAAWEVVARLRELFPASLFSILETFDEAQGKGLRYGVHILHYLGMGDFRTEGQATADTAPHAICLAALRAVDARPEGAADDTGADRSSEDRGGA
jgi:hypothetical protein